MSPRVAALGSALVVASILLLPSAGTAHAPGFAFAAFGTPSIDGTLSPDEWESASRHAFVANAPGGTVPGELLVMNDELRLYVGVRLATPAATSMAASFDNDHDGLTPEEGDDGFALDELDRLFDTVRSGRGGCPPGAICGFRDAELGGTNDVGAARAVHGGETHVELWHSLDSADDANDVSAGAGQTLGLGLQVGICTAATCLLTPVVPFVPMGDVLVTEPVAPETQVVDGPDDGSLVASRSASFGLSGSDNVDTPPQLTFACSIDQGPFATCASPAVYGDLVDGPHSFAVRAGDRSGNVDQTPATRAWTVDATAPETAVTDAPPRLTRSRSARFSFSGSDAQTPQEALEFVCSFDGGPRTECTAPSARSRLRDGRHTFAVAATDRAGNVDESPAAHVWTVDATPPVRPRVRGPRATESRRPVFRFHSLDARTRASELDFLCAVDARRLRRCPAVFRPRLDPGRHVVRAAALDEAGNRSAVATHRVLVRRR